MTGGVHDELPCGGVEGGEGRRVRAVRGFTRQRCEAELSRRRMTAGQPSAKRKVRTYERLSIYAPVMMGERGESARESKCRSVPRRQLREKEGAVVKDKNIPIRKSGGLGSGPDTSTTRGASASCGLFVQTTRTERMEQEAVARNTLRHVR